MVSQDIDEMASRAFGVTSFTSVGHLLHINLKDHLLNHKKEIGEALLKEHPRALAVVNKVSNIDNEYRNFDIEIIAKREDCTKTDDELMIAEVNENKCRFRLDFSKVYWNSRLSTEHERIIKKLHPSVDIVFDLFAGVGPFAVPAAKLKCQTYANDLNPEAVKWMKTNMTRNKVKEEFYNVYNMDAKDFILDELRVKLIDEYEKFKVEELATKPNIHILMNLPATAPTFLPYFIGLFRDEPTTITEKKLIDVFREQSLNHVLYCYCFLKGLFENPKAQVKSLIEEHLGKELTPDQLVDIFRVRNVAPYKDMYRVEIRLDESILFGQRGIMKNTSKQSTNGIASSTRRVTIGKLPNGKRSRNDSDDDSEASSKRGRFSEYCSFM